MLRHMRKQHISLVCDQCDQIFFSKSALEKHVKQAHEASPKEFRCTRCNKTFGRSDNLLRHSKLCNEQSGSGIGRKRPANPTPEGISVVKGDFTIAKLRSAFNGAVQTWRISFNEANDIISQLKDAILAMKGPISSYRHQRVALKFTMAIHAVFVKATDSTVITDPAICLVSQPFQIYSDTDINNQLLNAYKQLLNDIDVFERNGSGWVLSHLVALDTSVWELDPLRASNHHRLPQWVINKRAVRNIQNTDNECFKWAVIAGLNDPSPGGNPCRVDSYRRYEDQYDWSMLMFPVLLRDIQKFEKANNVSINVYG